MHKLARLFLWLSIITGLLAFLATGNPMLGGLGKAFAAVFLILFFIILFFGREPA